MTKAWFPAAGVILLIGFIPGMPNLLFVFFGLLAAAAGYYFFKSQKKKYFLLMMTVLLKMMLKNKIKLNFKRLQIICSVNSIRIWSN